MIITVIKTEDGLAITSPLFNERIFLCEIHQKDLKLQIILCIYDKYTMYIFLPKC